MSQTAQRRMQKWLRYNLTNAGKHPILQGPMFMDTGDETAGAWTQSKRGVHTGQLEVVRTFSQHDVSAFTALTGDENPIHAHGPHAAVVPGMLLASLFPSLIGTHYPGSLYLNQTLKFRQQVVVGDTVKAKVVVERQSGQRAKFLTTCYVFKEGNNRAEEILAVEGTALALLG